MIRATIIALAMASPAIAATDSTPFPFPLREGMAYYPDIGFRLIEDCSVTWQYHHHDSYRQRITCDDDAYAKLGKGAHLVAMYDGGYEPYTIGTLGKSATATTSPAVLPRQDVTTWTIGGSGGETWIIGGNGCGCKPTQPKAPVTPSPVPLPATGLMLLAWLFGFIGWRKK